MENVNELLFKLVVSIRSSYSDLIYPKIDKKRKSPSAYVQRCRSCVDAWLLEGKKRKKRRRSKQSLLYWLRKVLDRTHVTHVQFLHVSQTFYRTEAGLPICLFNTGYLHPYNMRLGRLARRGV